MLVTFATVPVTLRIVCTLDPSMSSYSQFDTNPELKVFKELEFINVNALIKK
jgi:hypothetical protein